MKLEDKCKRYIIKRLLNVYCEIFGTRSYGGDALASSCVLRHMNSCRIFHNIHSITYNYDQSNELDTMINKDVLWFFIKLVLQKIMKTHDNVCCALTPRYNVLQEKTITWTKGALHIY